MELERAVRGAEDPERPEPRPCPSSPAWSRWCWPEPRAACRSRPASGCTARREPRTPSAPRRDRLRRALQRVGPAELVVPRHRRGRDRGARSGPDPAPHGGGGRGAARRPGRAHRGPGGHGDPGRGPVARLHHQARGDDARCVAVPGAMVGTPGSPAPGAAGSKDGASGHDPLARAGHADAEPAPPAVARGASPAAGAPASARRSAPPGGAAPRRPRPPLPSRLLRR